MAPRTGQRSIGDFVKDTLEDFNDDGEINNSNARNISDIVKDVLDDMGPGPQAPTAPAPKPQRRPDPFEPKHPEPAPAEEDVRSKIELFGSETADVAIDAYPEEDIGGLSEYTDDYAEYGATDDYGPTDEYGMSDEYGSSMEADTGAGYESEDYVDHESEDYAEYDDSETQQYAADAF
jgi:hypothetical protein